MVDETTSTESPVGDEGPALPPDSGASEAKTTNVALIIGAVIAFFVIAGLAAAAVFLFVLRDAVEDVVIDTTTSVVATTTADPALADPVEPGPVPLTTVFTFRDVFDPLLKPLPEEQASTTTSPTASPDGVTPGTDTSFPEGMLVLLDIVPQDTGYAAVFSWNGQTYTLLPGERIPDSPWQLVSASPTEVVMLYGDVRVTLTIGTRVVK